MTYEQKLEGYFELRANVVAWCDTFGPLHLASYDPKYSSVCVSFSASSAMVTLSWYHGTRYHWIYFEVPPVFVMSPRDNSSLILVESLFRNAVVQ